MSKYVTNFQIGDEIIEVKDPNAMPANDGHFTSPISAPSVSATGNISAGGNISASGNLTGENVRANNLLSGSNATLGASDKENDTYVSAKNQNGEVALNVSTNRGLYDPTSEDWMIYRGLYEGRESFRSVATSFFLNGYPIHHPIDSGWKNLSGTWLRYRMRDRRVTIRVDARENTALTAGAWTTIGTLPEGYRPGYAVYDVGYPVGGNSILHVYVGTNGQIQVYNPTANSVNSYSFTVEYITGNTLKRLYIMTYNLGEFANGTGHGMSEADYQAKIDGMQRFFNAMDANVMFFNEYRDYIDSDDTHSTRSNLFPVGRWSSFRETDSTLKNAIISKTSTHSPQSGYLVEGQSSNKYLKCYTEYEGKTVYLICVHLHATDAAIRSAEMDAIITMCSGLDNVIVAGDFNFAPTGDEYKTQFNKAVAAGFTLSNGGVAGYIGTWPKEDNSTWGPRQSWYIDNIMCKGALEIGAVNVPVQAGNIVPSDHFPLWSYVELY